MQPRTSEHTFAQYPYIFQSKFLKENHEGNTGISVNNCTFITNSW